MPLTGILLLTPIFLPEQDPAVRDVVAVRSVPLWQTYSARALYSLLFLCLLPALLILCMGFLRSQVTPDPVSYTHLPYRQKYLNLQS